MEKTLSPYPGGQTVGRENRPDELFEAATGHAFDDYDGVIRSALARRPIQEADREDCRQEVWLELLATRIGRFRGGDLRAWLATVSRNRANDVLRRARRRPAVDVTAIDPPSSEESALASRADEARALVWAALRALEPLVHPVNFLVFFLRGMEGWSFAEIGEAFGLAPSQARLRYHRVKQKFRDLAAAKFA